MAGERFLDDIARTATSAVGVLQSALQEVEALARARFERLLDRMELVPRDEFEAVKAMAVKARQENAALAERLAVLEAALASLRGAPRLGARSGTPLPAHSAGKDWRGPNRAPPETPRGGGPEGAPAPRTKRRRRAERIKRA